MLVEANNKPHDIMIYTDDSVEKDLSGWEVTAKQGERTNIVEPTESRASVSPSR